MVPEATEAGKAREEAGGEGGQGGGQAGMVRGEEAQGAAQEAGLSQFVRREGGGQAGEEGGRVGEVQAVVGREETKGTGLLRGQKGEGVGLLRRQKGQGVGQTGQETEEEDQVQEDDYGEALLSDLWRRSHL